MGTSLSRLGAAQMAGAKYLGKSLKKMTEIEKKQAALEAKLIEGQSKLVKGTADAMIAGADAQADSTRQQAVGQIVGGAVGVAGSVGTFGAQAYGASKYSLDEADLNQQMSDQLSKPVPALEAEGTAQSEESEDTAPQSREEDPQVKAQARLKELFGEGADNSTALSEKADKAGFLKGKKLSLGQKEIADNVTDSKVREEMATKFSDRAKALREKAVSQRQSFSEKANSLQAFSTAASSLVQASFNTTSAQNQSEKGQQDAIAAQYQGAEQSRKAAADAAHGQTQADMQLIKDQVEAMRRIASPN